MAPFAFTERLRELGHRFDPEVLAATRSLYRSHVDLSLAGEERRDVAYGQHERHRLDLYLPASSSKGVVVFVHGGGFVAGDKNGDGVFYANLGRWLARAGFTAVLPNYRLAPHHGWPAGARDVGAALAWEQMHLAELAEKNASLVLWGQSAGASHVASYLFDGETRGGACAPLSAVLLMSGFFELEEPLSAGAAAYFGHDPAVYAQRSPLMHVSPSDCPIWLGLAEFDPGWIAQHTYAMARALTRVDGRSPDLHLFRGHNHVSTVQSLGSPHRDAGDEVLRFLRKICCDA